jgi:Tfp pilus assembly protein PilF
MKMNITVLHLLFLLAIQSCSTSKTGSKDLDQRNAQTFYKYGTHHLIRKEYSKALDYLLKAVAFDQNDHEIQNNLAMAYYFKGQNLKAISHLKKSIEIKNDYPEAKNNLASVYFNSGMLNESEKIYKEILDDLTYTGQYRTYYNLALISQKKGDMRSMEMYLKNAVSDNPDYCPAQFQLGSFYENNDDLNNAKIHYKKATLNDCFKEPAPNLALSLLLVKQKMWFEAEGRLSDFANRFPEHESINLIKKNLRFVQSKLKSSAKENSTAIQKEVNSSYKDLDNELDWDESANSTKSPDF